MSEFKKVGWRSPSNIAIVKYWGKHGVQLPNNASLSMSLSACYSETSIRYRQNECMKVSFKFDGKTNLKFEVRIQNILKELCAQFPFLEKLEMEIDSFNSFPHSAGIASSASSMSALALCLCSISEDLEDSRRSKTEFFTLASEIARLASGSASRSVYGGYSMWGTHPDFSDASDRYAIPVPNIHPEFENWYDAVLIVHAGIKNFSSTKGHQLMANNPYSELRYQNAKVQLSLLLKALQAGDVDAFVKITEQEALTLHAMMMTSGDGYFEMRPQSLEIMQRVRQFRNETGLPVAFTLDAGPNVHILYAESARDQVKNWIEKELILFCENRKWVDDKIGFGPVKLDI